MMTRIRSRRRLLAAAVALGLVAAACGDDDSGTAETTTPAAVETTDAAPTTGAEASTTAAPGSDEGGEGGPQRVVSLSPTHTEIMFAIGAGDRLVAVDDFSNYPEQALDLPNDLSGFEPNVEAIASYEPDLVLIGGDFTGLGEQLDGLGIEWWDGPAAETIDDTYAQIEQLGAITGNVGEAAELVAQMQTDIDAIVASTDVPEGLTYYHELTPDLFSVTSNTFIGDVYSRLGLTSIADELPDDAGGFPQLNAEFVVSANPEVIIHDDCCAESAETIGGRDGWGTIAAVESGAIIEVDDDIASRWGPRVVVFLETVADSLQSVPTGS